MTTTEDELIRQTILRVESRSESFRDAARAVVDWYAPVEAAAAEKEALLDALAEAAHGRRVLDVTWKSVEDANNRRVLERLNRRHPAPTPATAPTPVPWEQQT
jgi:predicted deacetylase